MTYTIYGTPVKFVKMGSKFGVRGAGRLFSTGTTKQKALRNARTMAYYDKERYFGSK